MVWRSRRATTLRSLRVLRQTNLASCRCSPRCCIHDCEASEEHAFLQYKLFAAASAAVGLLPKVEHRQSCINSLLLVSHHDRRFSSLASVIILQTLGYRAGSRRFHPSKLVHDRRQWLNVVLLFIRLRLTEHMIIAIFVAFTSCRLPPFPSSFDRHRQCQPRACSLFFSTSSIFLLHHCHRTLLATSLLHKISDCNPVSLSDSINSS